MAQSAANTKLSKDLFENLLEGVDRIGKHTAELCAIVLENIPQEEIVDKLRKSILRYRAYRHFHETNKNNSSTIPALEGYPEDLILGVSEVLEVIGSPYKRHDKLIEQIAIVIRREDLTAHVKVEKISNILL